MSDDPSELEQLLSFVYECPAAVMRIRRDGHILLTSAAACGLLLPRAPGGDLVNLFDVLDKAAPSVRAAVTEFAAETGTIVEQHQVRWLDAAGAPCVIAISIVAVDRETCAVVLHDVTRVVEQERRLYAQEQRLRAIIDSVPDYAIFTLDPEGKIDSWNRSLGRLTALDAESLLGQPLFSLTTSADATALSDLLERARRAGWAEYAAPHRRGASREFWGEAVVTPIFAPSEEMIGYGVVLRDATAKRRYEEELLRLTRMDPLTGVLNRRGFLDAADRELSRGQRRDLSIVMLDVDHFKSVNDRHGHGVGDEVLRALACAGAHMIRSGDVLARLGGEEFAVLAPGTPVEEAAALAERLREAVAELQIPTPSGAPLRVTLSAGVASLPASSKEPIAAAMHRADEALYAAKRSGRNRVCLAA